MKIYTKKGDQGKTHLLGGLRVLKNHPQVKTYGAVDELQSHLGMARALIQEKTLSKMVLVIQETLLTAGAELSATSEAVQKLERRISSREVVWLEKQIDALTETHDLPHGFVIPGASADSAVLHVARSVCRRCERLILMLSESPGTGPVPEASSPGTTLPDSPRPQTPAHDRYDFLLIYFNRLSDLLFAMAWALEVRALVKQIVMELLDDILKGKRPCS